MIMIAVAMAAAFPLLLKLTAPLFCLAAVLAMLADRLVQSLFGLVDLLFTLTVAITIAVLCLGCPKATEHETRRKNCRYDSLFPNHSTSMVGTILHRTAKKIAPPTKRKAAIWAKS
jgi:magnesium-transporting ATPase (P-type)